jgi:hypothetical protein
LTARSTCRVLAWIWNTAAELIKIEAVDIEFQTRSQNITVKDCEE